MRNYADMFSKLSASAGSLLGSNECHIKPECKAMDGACRPQLEGEGNGYPREGGRGGREREGREREGWRDGGREGWREGWREGGEGGREGRAGRERG